MLNNVFIYSNLLRLNGRHFEKPVLFRLDHLLRSWESSSAFEACFAGTSMKTYLPIVYSGSTQMDFSKCFLLRFHAILADELVVILIVLRRSRSLSFND